MRYSMSLLGIASHGFITINPTAPSIQQLQMSSQDGTRSDMSCAGIGLAGIGDKSFVAIARPFPGEFP